MRTRGFVGKAFSLSNTTLASLSHSDFPVFLSSLKKGNHLSPSLEINLLSVTIHPVRFWMSLVDCVCVCGGHPSNCLDSLRIGFDPMTYDKAK